jgi:hypothetical protein
MALYPKQPFDFAGRTGVIAFDVTNDSHGPHTVWPELWLSDQPVPTPFTHFPMCNLCNVPRNGFGIRFSATDGVRGWAAESVVISRNYVIEDRGIYDGNKDGTIISQTGSVARAKGPNDRLNHVELKISQSQIDIYATNPGSTSLVLINTIRNANLTFSRGLVWFTDGHYAANKDAPGLSNHTFTWDNLAFDGPVLDRDLSYDVLDADVVYSKGPPTVYSTGWWAPTPRLSTLPMAQTDISRATAALLMFNFGSWTQPTTFSYSVNGHDHTFANPMPPYYGKRTIAMPVPLMDLVDGPQSVTITSDVSMMSVQNVNIVLVGASKAPDSGATPPGTASQTDSSRSGAKATSRDKQR